MRLKHVKEGDVLTRMLGGAIAMKVIVGKVTSKHVICGSADGVISWEDGWTFDRETGIEEDKDLGWGRDFRVSGSFIIMDGEPFPTNVKVRELDKILEAKLDIIAEDEKLHKNKKNKDVQQQTNP
jgi:hypothetical protein